MLALLEITVEERASELPVSTVSFLSAMVAIEDVGYGRVGERVRQYW